MSCTLCVSNWAAVAGCSAAPCRLTPMLQVVQLTMYVAIILKYNHVLCFLIRCIEMRVWHCRKRTSTSSLGFWIMHADGVQMWVAPESSCSFTSSATLVTTPAIQAPAWEPGAQTLVPTANAGPSSLPLHIAGNVFHKQWMFLLSCIMP